MINTLTRTYEATGKGINKVDVEIRYELGGMNWWTGRPSPRGYYFSYQPYELGEHFRTYTVGRNGHNGVKMCVLPCERQSKKRFEKAAAMMQQLVDEYLPGWLAEDGVTIGDEYTETTRER